MSRQRILIGSCATVLLALVLLGCHTVPLGDPEKSVADASLAGWWLDNQGDKSHMLIYVMPYDARTQIVTAYSYSTNGDTIKAEIKFTNKAWMTTVGGMDIMCLKIIDPEWDLEGGADAAARYVYYRIKKPDAGSIEITPLNIDFLKETKTPDELAKKIADNVNNPELWKGSDPLLVKHVPDDKKEEIKKIVQAFGPAKQ